jgi:hypothetical protein
MTHRVLASSNKWHEGTATLQPNDNLGVTDVWVKTMVFYSNEDLVTGDTNSPKHYTLYRDSGGLLDDSEILFHLFIHPYETVVYEPEQPIHLNEASNHALILGDKDGGPDHDYQGLNWFAYGTEEN